MSCISRSPCLHGGSWWKKDCGVVGSVREAAPRVRARQEPSKGEEGISGRCVRPSAGLAPVGHQQGGDFVSYLNLST